LANQNINLNHWHSSLQNLVRVSRLLSLGLALSNPFCRLEFDFSFGFSWTVHERCEFIFTSALRDLGLVRSYFTWILINLHSYFFLDRLSGVIFLFKALTDLPSGFLSISSPSVLIPTPPSLSFKLITGLSLELFSEFLMDYILRWYYFRSTNLSFLRCWYY